MRSNTARRLLLTVLGVVAAGGATSPASAQDTKLSPPARTAALSAMKQGLRQMVLIQSTRYESHKSFTSSPPRESGKAPDAYRIEIVAADLAGWTGVTTSTADPALHCGIFVGRGAAPNAAVVAPTVPACWRVNGDGSIDTQ